MNKLNTQKRAQILSCLVEGNSIRSTVRMTGAAKNTVVKLLVDVGAACSAYQDETLRDLPCRRLQCDGIWSFCYSKAKNVPEDKQGQFGYGDVWTWTAICADTKLVPSWYVGSRDSVSGKEFIEDLAGRLANRVQLSTDGLRVYLEAVERSFGSEIDYAIIHKLYGQTQEPERRYSPSVCIGAESPKIVGSPDPRHISTSLVERQNLTMRMRIRRFTRLTNAFSKTVENLTAAVSLHFMYYNFVRVHSSLRVTPAMEAGVTARPWTLEQVAELADEKISVLN